jgi:4-oxalocrotonate tautomerase
MPLIQVTMIEGRTLEQKHALIAELTAAAERALSVPAERVRIAIYEVSGDNWGIGGTPYSAVRGAPSTQPPSGYEPGTATEAT